MNIKDIKIKSVDRIIAHTIVGKTVNQDARASVRDNLLTVSPKEKAILIERIMGALVNSKKTFQLEFEDKSADSIYGHLSGNSLIGSNNFIDYSKRLAHKLALAHFRINIPGGYCLVGNGTTRSAVPFFFIIKAEWQQVFNIQADKLQLINDVFL